MVGLAKRIIADKRTRVVNLVGDPEVLTCAQPVNECRMRQGHVEGVFVTPVRQEDQAEHEITKTGHTERE